MFTHISAIKPYGCDKQLEDFIYKEILYQLNNGCFFDRVFPRGDLKQDLDRIVNEIISLGGSEESLNCHTVTKKLVQIRPSLRIAYGYLTISKNPLKLSSAYYVVDKKMNCSISEFKKWGKDFQANQMREKSWVMKIDEKYEHVTTKLLHHSLVLDEQGNYIECICNRYPLASGEDDIGYVFFPHESGQLGYNFLAEMHLPSPSA